MSVSNIPEKVKIRLWGKAAGRCQYEGCNKPLWVDSLTKAEFNTAYIAHIIADKPKGPRGHHTRSEALKDDITNLMLMCDEHHRLIDREDVAGHPEERLTNMKKNHEERIELLGSLQPDKKSHVLLYGANVGEQSAPLTWSKAAQALLPEWYPADTNAIELSLKNSVFQDHEEDFWKMEINHLEKQFVMYVRPRLSFGDISHFSIFSIALLFDDIISNTPLLSFTNNGIISLSLFVISINSSKWALLLISISRIFGYLRATSDN